MLTMSPHSTDRIGEVPANGAFDEGVARVTSGGAEWLVREKWRDQLLGPGAPNWFALSTKRGATRVKLGRYREVWRLDLDRHTVYAKIIDQGSLMAGLKARLLGTAAKREWHAALKAERRRVPVVRALGVGRKREAGGKTVFLSEGPPGAVTLPKAWERHVACTGPGGRRLAAAPLIDASARLFAVAHEQGFRHRDAHPGNILVRTPAGGPWEAMFVDVLGASTSGRRVSFGRSIDALARLDHYFHRLATQTERLRFLRAYTRYRASGRQGVSRWLTIRKIIATLGEARTVHASELARQRDQRLRRDGKYFATFPVGRGWKVTAALTLERRHVFPERDVPDRTIGQWRDLLRRTLSAVATGENLETIVRTDGLRFAARYPSGTYDRLWWAIGTAPDRRVFNECHRRRHRDEPGDLILACAEHKTGGLVDATVLIRPDKCECVRPGESGSELGD